MLIKQRRSKNLAEIQKEWNEVRVTASEVTTLRRIRKVGYNLRVSRVGPLLSVSQCRKRLNCAKEKDWNVGQWSNVLLFR